MFRYVQSYFLQIVLNSQPREPLLRLALHLVQLHPRTLISHSAHLSTRPSPPIQYHYIPAASTPVAQHDNVAPNQIRTQTPRRQRRTGIKNGQHGKTSASSSTAKQIRHGRTSPRSFQALEKRVAENYIEKDMV